MAASHHYYHRINCNSTDPFRDARVGEFNADPDDSVAHVISLMSNRVPTVTGAWATGDMTIIVEAKSFAMPCVDGVIRNFTVWWDEEGRSKGLIPNLRANALFYAGCFTSVERIQFADNYNQQIKDEYGCNFVFGDLVVQVPEGTPPPDHKIYGRNPLQYILQPREPSAEMIAVHGRELATNKLSPKRKVDVEATIRRGSFDPRSFVWRDVPLLVAPSSCRDLELRILLATWGVTDEDLSRIIPSFNHPLGYGYSLEFSREWEMLNQADKDCIWRLSLNPGSSNSATYDEQGVERRGDDIFRLVFGDCTRNEGRQCIIKLMKSYDEPSDPPPLVYSLRRLEAEITSAYQHDPALIYFHHQRDMFHYMLGRPSDDAAEGPDEQDFRSELRKLRRGLRDGRIISVVQGEPLTIGGRELFTMEVEFKDIECHPYILLRRDGCMAHAAKTPYFFLVFETGANAVAWVNRRDDLQVEG